MLRPRLGQRLPISHQRVGTDARASSQSALHAEAPQGVCLRAGPFGVHAACWRATQVDGCPVGFGRALNVRSSPSGWRHHHRARHPARLSSVGDGAGDTARAHPGARGRAAVFCDVEGSRRRPPRVSSGIGSVERMHALQSPAHWRSLPPWVRRARPVVRGPWRALKSQSRGTPHRGRGTREVTEIPCLCGPIFCRDGAHHGRSWAAGRGACPPYPLVSEGDARWENTAPL